MMWVLWYIALSAFFAFMCHAFDIHAVETKNGPLVQPNWLSYVVAGALWPIMLALWVLVIGGMVLVMAVLILVIAITMCGALCVELWNQIRRKS